MTIRSYEEMDEDGSLTAAEIGAGWTFCHEFDGLLVNRTEWPHCRDMGYLCGYCRTGEGDTNG